MRRRERGGRRGPRGAVTAGAPKVRFRSPPEAGSQAATRRAACSETRAARAWQQYCARARLQLRVRPQRAPAAAGCALGQCGAGALKRGACAAARARERARAACAAAPSGRAPSPAGWRPRRPPKAAWCRASYSRGAPPVWAIVRRGRVAACDKLRQAPLRVPPRSSASRNPRTRQADASALTSRHAQPHRAGLLTCRALFGAHAAALQARWPRGRRGMLAAAAPAPPAEPREACAGAHVSDGAAAAVAPPRADATTALSASAAEWRPAAAAAAAEAASPAGRPDKACSLLPHGALIARR